MERVLIVAKTRMKSGFCVSGLVRHTNKHIRLIPPGRTNQPPDTKLEIGQVWDIEYQEIRDLAPPHTEDVLVTQQHYVGQVKDLRSTLLQRVQPWRGEPRDLFDRCLIYGGKSCYVAAAKVPNVSTGYWLPQADLTLSYANGKGKPTYKTEYSRYLSELLGSSTLYIPYVGVANPIPRISANMLLRVSLARWWMPDGAEEEGCYLQLSGWYD